MIICNGSLCDLLIFQVDDVPYQNEDHQLRNVKTCYLQNESNDSIKIMFRKILVK